MLKLLKNCFKTTNNSIIVILPMILCMLVIQYYFEIIKSSINEIPKFIVACLALWVLFSGFCAGWFYMVKRAITFSQRIFVYDKDRNTALKEVLAGFFKGFRKLYSSFLIVIAIGLIIRITEFKITRDILPDLGIKLNYGYNLFLICVVVSFIAYWCFLWIPEIIYSEQNPYKALINSVKKNFISFNQTIKLFAIVWILFFVMNILFQLSMINPYLYFFAMLINYYLILYTSVLILMYYEQNFIRQN